MLTKPHITIFSRTKNMTFLSFNSVKSESVSNRFLEYSWYHQKLFGFWIFLSGRVRRTKPRSIWWIFSLPPLRHPAVPKTQQLEKHWIRTANGEAFHSHAVASWYIGYLILEARTYFSLATTWLPNSSSWKPASSFTASALGEEKYTQSYVEFHFFFTMEYYG